MTPQAIAACIRTLSESLSPAELSMVINNCNFMDAAAILSSMM